MTYPPCCNSDKAGKFFVTPSIFWGYRGQRELKKRIKGERLEKKSKKSKRSKNGLVEAYVKVQLVISIALQK